MQLEIRAQSIETVQADAVVVGVFSDGIMTPSAAYAEAACEGAITEMIAEGDFDTQLGSTIVLRDMEGIWSRRLVLLGLGKLEDYDDEAYVKAVDAALKATKAKTVALPLEDWIPPTRSIEWAVEHFARLALTQKEPLKCDEVTLIDDHTYMIVVEEEKKSITKALKLGQAKACAVNNAKHWANMPSNFCTPDFLAQTAQKMADIKHVTVKIHDAEAIRKLGMNAFLAVAQGSKMEPRFIELHYTGAAKDKAPIVMVGKGITFDAGGLCLKPGAHMTEMKYDMCGAAAVMAAFKAVAKMGLKRNLIALIPACENMPDGVAYKPSDVITALNGKTIEVQNTDAEGRLLLADALAYAERFNPKTIVDVATLTGAMGVALGNHHHGLFVNDPKLCKAFEEAADRTMEPLWALPFGGRYYTDLLKSNVADIANIGPRGEAGASVAATFLSKFVPEGTAWAHLDIAMTAWKSGRQPQATGRPVPLLIDWLVNA